eukprot:CAMPEP_0168726616 /NCGR_PEP_ID=MMETSP0724-20121128/4758_1 /TAXON_ID=265536 /ORGANISM="Amphiprora sp., Strain CCMP467" /LENGTH=385 /DNA_ID=CAMNT_0008773431 /DNA_START=61 /DNA_END=1218 /DNA_ORIENTATION=+
MAFGRRTGKPVLNYDQLNSETSIEELLHNVDKAAPGEEHQLQVNDACEMSGDLSSIGESFDSIFEEGDEKELFSDDDDDDEHNNDPPTVQIDVDTSKLGKNDNIYSAACIQTSSLHRAKTTDSVHRHHHHGNPRRKDLKTQHSFSERTSSDHDSKRSVKVSVRHEPLSSGNSSHSKMSHKPKEHKKSSSDDATITSHRSTDTGRRHARRKLEKSHSFRHRRHHHHQSHHKGGDEASVASHLTTDTGRRRLRRTKSMDGEMSSGSGHRTTTAPRRPTRRTLGQKSHSFRHQSVGTAKEDNAEDTLDNASIHTTKTKSSNIKVRRRRKSICHAELDSRKHMENSEVDSRKSTENSEGDNRRNVAVELTASGKHEFLQFDPHQLMADQ